MKAAAHPIAAHRKNPSVSRKSHRIIKVIPIECITVDSETDEKE